MITNKWLGLIFIVISSLFCGCSIKGLTSGYNKLTPKEKKEILDFQENQNTNSDFEMINGKQVLSLVRNDENALVYLWTPHCHSSSCKPISIIADQCAAKNIKLYVVANEFELKEIKKEVSKNQKIYFLDYKFYNTNSKIKGVKRFLSDIVMSPKKESNDEYNLPDSIFYSNHLYFKNGNFIGVKDRG